METRSISRATVAAMAIALSVVLTACGGGDDESEPTATTEPVQAQPTVEATVESTPIMATPPASASTQVVPPRNTDMSSPRVESNEASTPPASLATPNSAETGIAGETATPSTSTVEESAAGTPVIPETVETPAATDEATPEDTSTSDGTSGATSQTSNDIATPLAPATPSTQATPEPASSPVASAEVPVVTSCDVENVPAFTGDVTVYTLSVDLNFRAGPGADCDLIGDGPLGEFSAVEVIGGPVEREGDDSGEWVQVQVGDQVGWLAFQYLDAAE